MEIGIHIYRERMGYERVISLNSYYFGKGTFLHSLVYLVIRSFKLFAFLVLLLILLLLLFFFLANTHPQSRASRNK